MSSNNKGKYDVFISYNSQDKDIVKKIALRLADEEKLSVFFDEWSLVPGQPLQEQLEYALQHSDSCAIFVGEHGIGKWETEELRVVLEERIRAGEIRVIPVILQLSKKIEVSCLPPFLRRYLCIDYSIDPDHDDPLFRLLAGIYGKAPGRPSSSKIGSSSFFNTFSISDLLSKYSQYDLRSFSISWKLTLDHISKIINIHYPDEREDKILLDLYSARSRAYDEKYSNRSQEDDERYLDFNGWQNELRDIIRESCVADLYRLDVINVGIGNGNENPYFYREFKSITAVDTSTLSIKKAKLNMPFINELKGEAEDLRLIKSSSYDLYLSLRTYQSAYFDISLSALEASRVTKQRGVAIISIPNVYIDKMSISLGLQQNGGQQLDPHLSWEFAEKVRRALHYAEFSTSIITGLFEIFIIGKK